ncbi:aspartic peptidase domain-containing protein [Penicillium odoratum]|uniref:aspartic peptidase domain-containing protein n=1 Tax=Penicillium odoratum TaxID=1167516 RepID=UPI002548AB9C|nr:aspartic peptidase domain-containing protein [Penicillium odoratum]KAJ5753155.1 aspartic peptidase domain-containing protein [Penicillium odoratum]
MVQSWIASLLLSAAVASCAAVPGLTANTPGSLGRRTPSPDVVTNNHMPVRTVRKSHSLRGKRAQRGQHGLHRRQSTYSGGQTNITDPEQLCYVAAVTWGDETFDMLLDTGSSDTWLLQEGYKCLNSTGDQVPKSNCVTSPNFSGNYTGGQIGNVNFNATYGSASVAGTYGWEDITIAGITVHNAQVASVTEAYFQQTGVSGLFGLAFSSLTKEWPGNDPSKNIMGEGQNYEPVFYKMVNQKSSLPTFSFAPERNGNNGYLAFGGIPPVNTTGKTASTPILTTQVKETVPVPAIDRDSYYTINIDGTTVTEVNTRTHKTNTTNFDSFIAIVDSGSSVSYLPSAIATALARSFSPAATSSGGTYEVPCNATAPKVAFDIGGVNFTISPADLIMQSVYDSDTGLCAIGFQDAANDPPYILGGTFMNNVLTTFDLGALEMRFTALAANNWK